MMWTSRRHPGPLQHVNSVESCSCKRHLYILFPQAGADYLAFSPFLQSTSLPGAQVSLSAGKGVSLVPVHCMTATSHPSLARAAINISGCSPPLFLPLLRINQPDLCTGSTVRKAKAWRTVCALGWPGQGRPRALAGDLPFCLVLTVNVCKMKPQRESISFLPL